MGFWGHLLAVSRRELRIMRQRPIYLVGSVLTMLFCTVFYLTFFQSGLPNDLPVGVVDQDHSSLSRNFCRQLDATQLGRVVHYDDFKSAREDLQSGRIFGFCVLKEGFYQEVSSSRSPEIPFYVNGLYFVGGNLIYKDLLQIINTVNAGVQRQVLRLKGMNDAAIMGMVQPIRIDTHQIGNAYTHYGYYLSNMLLPATLELLIVILLIYAFGSELKYGTSHHLLRTAGGSMTVAMFGKVLVYTLLFCFLGFTLVLLLYDWLHFPMAGSVWNMFVAVFLLVISSESVALFILGCIPILRLSLSIGALYSVLGFSLAGFTLPVECLPPYIQGLSVAFPLRHYYLFFTQEVIFGNGFAGWWPQVVAMLLFLFLPLFVGRRLKNAYIEMNYPID